MQRLGCSPGRYLETATWALDVDVRDLLSLIDVPTLVIHRTGDRFAPSRRPLSRCSHPRSPVRRTRGRRPPALRRRQQRDLDAVEAFVTGRITRRRRAAHVVPVGSRRNGVTRREFEVLDLVASGATNAEIAEELHISSPDSREPHLFAAREAPKPEPSRSHRSRHHDPRLTVVRALEDSSDFTIHL